MLDTGRKKRLLVEHPKLTSGAILIATNIWRGCKRYGISQILNEVEVHQ